MPEDIVKTRDIHRNTQLLNAAKYARDKGWIAWYDSTEIDQKLINPLSRGRAGFYCW